MAFLSEILTEELGIPPKYKEEASICLFCGEEIKEGGMWATQRLHAGVCRKCAPQLLDWYIDTLLDTKVLDEVDDVENVKKLSSNIIDRYNRKKQKKIKSNKSHM